MGPSGFGYSDGDDATTVPTTPSLYLRRTFDVENLEQWLDAQFFMDYDDGFVAYLNGVEIARATRGCRVSSWRGTKPWPPTMRRSCTKAACRMHMPWI